MKPCDSYGKHFKLVGRHYAYCKSQDGKPYDHLLAKKKGKHVYDLTQPLLKPCLVCGREFKRLTIILNGSIYW